MYDDVYTADKKKKNNNGTARRCVFSDLTRKEKNNSDYGDNASAAAVTPEYYFN